MTIRTIGPAAARQRQPKLPYEGDEDRLLELLSEIRVELRHEQLFNRHYGQQEQRAA